MSFSQTRLEVCRNLEDFVALISLTILEDKHTSSGPDYVSW